MTNVVVVYFFFLQGVMNNLKEYEEVWFSLVCFAWNAKRGQGYNLINISWLKRFIHLKLIKQISRWCRRRKRDKQ